MSWLYSRALVAEYSAESCSDGGPSAPLSVMPTPHKFLRNDKTIEPSKLSRFGLTCEVLTASRGAELLTSYLAAFPAKTLALPEKAKESPANDQDSGKSSPGLLAKFDRGTHSLKTAQLSLIEDLTSCSPILPRSGSMLNGCVYQRPSVQRHTSATEFGYSVPTPTTTQAPNKGGNTKGPKSLMDVAAGEWTHILPTPTANRSGTNKSASAGAKIRPSLDTMATKNLWPTPTSSLSKQGCNQPDGKRGATLIDAIRHPEKWPTPKANDAEKRGNFDVNNPRNGLPAAARKWPTPKASDTKGSPSLKRTQERAQENPRGVPLPEELTRRGEVGQLNPEWVEWLMGWPIGWTELKPLEMDKCHEWRRAHLIYYSND